MEDHRLETTDTDTEKVHFTEHLLAVKLLWNCLHVM